MSQLSKREIENVTKEVRKPRNKSSAAAAATQLGKRAQQALRAKKIEATVQTDRCADPWWATVRLPLDELDAFVRQR